MVKDAFHRLSECLAAFARKSPSLLHDPLKRTLNTAHGIMYYLVELGFPFLSPVSHSWSDPVTQARPLGTSARRTAIIPDLAYA